jgi:hypothetical protein
MSSLNVIVPPDLSKLIIEREKVWVDFDRSQSQARDLNQLSNQIPDCVPAELQLQFEADSIPPTELETVLPMVKEKIETANRLKGEVKGCYDEIEAIKRKEKTVIVGIAVAGVVVLLVLLIVVIALVSGSSS